jgi:hypothetical protein
LLQNQTIYVGGSRPYNNQNGNFTTSDDYTPYQTYSIDFGATKLEKSEESFFDTNDKNIAITKKTEYEYNSQLSIKELRNYTSSGDIKINRFRYVSDILNGKIGTDENGMALNKLLRNNQITLPIEELNLNKKSDGNLYVIN